MSCDVKLLSDRLMSCNSVIGALPYSMGRFHWFLLVPHVVHVIVQTKL